MEISRALRLIDRSYTWHKLQKATRGNPYLSQLLILGVQHKGAIYSTKILLIAKVCHVLRYGGAFKLVTEYCKP